MTAISSLSDEEIDELLAGQAPLGRRELAPLADVATALRRRTAEEPAPVMTYPLRHAVARRVAPVEPHRSRRLVHAAVSGAAIALVGLAGVANALPAPVQEAVADVGDLVGVQVPHTADDELVELPEGADLARPAVSEAEDEGTEAKADRPPDTTPGDANPADPGTPGDLDPAVPAVPPEPEGDAGDEHQGVPNPNAGEGADNGQADDPPVDHHAEDADDEHSSADGDTTQRQAADGQVLVGDHSDS